MRANSLLGELKLNQPHLFYENTQGGHAGSSFFEDLARQQALFYTFFQQRLMDTPP